jgi:hypothetical protein
VAGVALSGIPLLLIPKCPACVAAYVALFTGISVSTVAAAQLQTGLMILGIALPACFTAFCFQAMWGKK